MNQLIRMQAHANQNTASTVPAITYARRLAAEGKTQSQIGIMVRAAGYRITGLDCFEIWHAHQEHLVKLERAMRAGA